MICSFVSGPRKVAQAGLLGLIFTFAVAMRAQDGSAAGASDNESFRAVPILTGSTAYFTKVLGGQIQDAPSVSPLLLVPVGDKWLLEGKGSYSETFSKDPDDNYYDNKASYGLAYAQADYITKYVTFTAGRFITPFNIYGERLAPNWVRNLQLTPLSVPVTSGSALGGMLRGGIPGTEKINLNYAFYFSANNTHHLLATDRSTGGRIGFFLPGPRLELGASFQQVLQAGRPHSSGLFFVWQPNRAPLAVRSEYVRSSGLKGSGYWIESAYRLSQISYLRKLELVGRAQQFFADPKLTAKQVAKLGAFGKDAQQGDFGLNYYFRTDVRASASYSRQFIQGNNANLWTVGMTWRFVMPLLPAGRPL